jgi:hypothetical protein
MPGIVGPEYCHIDFCKRVSRCINNKDTILCVMRSRHGFLLVVGHGFLAQRLFNTYDGKVQTYDVISMI